MAATLVRSAIDTRIAAGLLEAIDAHPAWTDRTGDGFNPYSSSLQLTALRRIDAGALAAQLLEGAAGDSCRAGLGATLAIDIDRCWVRRQFAPANAPGGHAPHSWHQDGALGFDFAAADAGPGETAPLPMRTCWVALTACGADAPGLELVMQPFDALLGLEQLEDAAVLRAARTRRWAPEMQPGDALVFDGGVLHRTHVTPSMQADRTSLELRFFDAASVPERLQGDRFVPIH